MRSEQQALANIKDLVAEARSRGWVTTRKLDAILADVQPEPAAGEEPRCEHGTTLSDLCRHVEEWVNREPAPAGGTIDRAKVMKHAEAALVQARLLREEEQDRDVATKMSRVLPHRPTDFEVVVDAVLAFVRPVS